MKYNIAILFILLGALSLSCAKINIATGEEEKTVKFTFLATREEIETETKTYLKNGVSIGWNVGDVVKLYLLHEEDTETEGIKDSTYINGSATVSGFNESTGIATFDASITVPEGAPVGNYEMFAVYGTIKTSTNIFGITDGSGSRNFRLSVLGEQNANEGSFDPRYANCVAHVSKVEVNIEKGCVTIPSDIKFYNCFALVGLTINENGDKIDSVVLSTNITSTKNEYHLAQHHYLRYRDPDNISVPEFKWSSAMGRDIVMKGPLSNATYYFVVSPISTVYKGATLKLTFYHSSSSYVYTSAVTSSKDENPFNRGSIFSLNKKGFNIPEISNWKGFQQKETNIDCNKTEATFNFTTYDRDQDNWTFDIIGSDFTATGASVEIENTGAEKTLNIKLPVNKSLKDLIYLVTATDKDENVGRTIYSKITQTKMDGDRVGFGTTWGKSFHDACIEDYNGSKTKGPFEGITFASYPNKTLTSSFFRGNMQFYFVAAESGEATMTFAKIRTAKARSDTLGKSTVFYVNDVYRTHVYTDNTLRTNYTVNLGQIEAGDTIKFSSNGSSSDNYVYPDSDGKLFDFKKVEE